MTEIVLTRRVPVGTRFRPRKWATRHWQGYRLQLARSTVRIVSRRWWGISAWSIVRDGVESKLWEADTYMELAEMKKRKPSGEAASTAVHLAAVESVVFSKLHPIVAHCSATKYDDGDARKPGWVTIKTMGSAWIVEAKDPDTCCRLTVVQSSLDDALALLSLMLEAEEAPWESDPWLKQQGSRKKS